MPQAEGQPEQPSMEEILASIRRIIAEDAATPPDTVGAAPRAAPAAETADEEVLELTEMVKDDGTVVSLTSSGAKPAAPPADVKVNFAQKKPAVVEMAPRFEPPPAEAAPPPPRANVSVELGMPPKPKPVPSAHPGEITLEPLELAEPEEEMPLSAGLSSADERLVSTATAAASMAALSRLADLGQHGVVSKEPLDESGRTLEALVRELLRPMLKHWLDDHLPAMVERLVREEIQRMARDAKVR